MFCIIIINILMIIACLYSLAHVLPDLMQRVCLCVAWKLIVKKKIVVDVGYLSFNMSCHVGIKHVEEMN